MSDNTQISSSLNKFRFIDILVLVVFLSTAVLGLYLFRRDLMQTIDTRDMEPAGIITIKNNIVQRRHEERVLWDRIYVDSLVYPGDLIRVAELSSAAIDIEKNELFLNENTLIRIEQSMGGNGNFRIELQGGEISVTIGAESPGIMLDVMGKQVQAMSGSVLNASAGEDGVSVQVSEGKAEFVQKGKIREIIEGAMIAFDAKGEEKVIASAVVISPKPNARYLKSGNERLVVDFLWNRVNFKEDGNLSLEIAGDSAFSRNISILNGLNDSAQASFDVGLWYWRLLYEGKVLKSGHLTVVNSSGPALVSPVNGSIFRYQDSLPQVRFQWEERQNALGYMIEISDNGDFSAPQISTWTNAASFVSSKLSAGTFYWRVKPVFIPVYKGEAAYSSAGSFQVIKTDEKTAAAVEIEIPVIPPERITAAPPQSSRGSSVPVIVRSAPRPEVKTEAKPASNLEPKLAAKPEPKPAAKPKAKSEPKLAVKPETKPDPKPVPKPEPKPAVKQETKPEVKPEIKPEVKFEINPEVQLMTNPKYNLPPVQVLTAKPMPAPMARPTAAPVPTPPPTPTPAPPPAPPPKSTPTPPRAVIPAPSPAKNTGRNYTIQPGDTLGKLAGRYYGDPMQWPRITAVNNIENPDLIYPGQVFIIP